jgi:hypothetical protein
VEGGIPFASVALDAGPHLIICGFGSGDEGFVIIRGREFQGVFTLAASATPGYQSNPFHWQKILFLLLHSHPSLYASIEVVFDSTHFGDQIGALNQPRMGIAAGDEQFNSLSPPVNEIENLVNRYQAIMNSHIRFIKNH